MMWHLSHKVHGDRPWAVQTEALRRSAGVPKFGHWLEQGLGKTSLNLNEFIDSDDADINVVLAPNSFIGDWVMAPQEWGVPWLKTGLRRQDELPFDETYCLFGVNYEMARDKRYNMELQRLFEKRRCMLTIDESTAVKNPESGTFKAVLELAKRAAVVRELNGTPLTQDVFDYYGQLRMLGQLNGMTPTVFKNRFAEKGGFFGKQIVGTRNEAELARIINSCTFRALKKDWRKDLPPKIYSTVHLSMSDTQRQHYQTMMEEFYTIVGGKEITADLVLTQMDKLRQISSCILMDHGEHHFIEDDKKNPKLQALLAIIDSSPGKVIVSHYYKPSGALLLEALRKRKLNPAFIRGGMKPADILEQKARFNDDTSCRVIVGQQDATARGHTLIGQAGHDRCSTMVFYENSFSYYWRSQMEDRNNRGAQDKDCNVYDLVTSPADQLTVDILTGKGDLANRMDAIIAFVREQQT